MYDLKNDFPNPMSCDISNERFSDDLHDLSNWDMKKCHVTYQMKGNDFNIRPSNVLDKLGIERTNTEDITFYLMNHMTWDSKK